MIAPASASGHRRLLAVLLLLALLLPAPADAGWPGRVAATTRLQAGSFLVASRDLRDPNFRQSVILLVDYSDQGATGLILNRPTRVPFAKAIPEIDALKRLGINLYLGGPVARYRVGLLVRSPKPLPKNHARHLFGPVYFSTRLATLLSLLKEVPPGVSVHAYAGHAGWAPGQLESEVRRGGWHVIAADAATCFDTDPSDVWSTLIERVEPRAILTRLMVPRLARRP